MVYMGVEVTTCYKIYDDGVKVGVATSIPINEPFQMDSEVLLM